MLDKADELPEPKDRALTKASEYRALWHVTDPLAKVERARRCSRHCRMPALDLFTGARPSEAAGLKGTR